jgi:hypothetical protein
MVNECQIKEDELGRAVWTCKEKRNAYRDLEEKYEGKHPHGRPRHRWVGENKPDVENIGRGGVGWDGFS